MEKLSSIFNQDFVNNLANYICEKVNSGDNNLTVISVVDFDRLFVIKGKTTNKKEKDISEIIDGFITDNSSSYTDLDPMNIKTINLIEYETNRDYFNVGSINLKSDVQSNVHLAQVVNSHFPHGYNENSIKLFNLMNDVKPYFKYDNFNCSISLNENKITFTNITTDSYYNDDKILSILKDNFDSEDINELSTKDKFLNII
jgi:hypothetical protein